MTRIRPEINGEKLKSILFSLTMRLELLISTPNRLRKQPILYTSSLPSIILENFIRLARLNQLPKIISRAHFLSPLSERDATNSTSFPHFHFQYLCGVLAVPQPVLTSKTSN